MDVQFLTSVAVVTPDPAASRALYVDALGLAFNEEPDGYLHSEDIAGTNSFGVWPLTAAATACFGVRDWPKDRPVPQLSVEFELPTLEAVTSGADELRAKGYALLHEPQTQPWGQTVARLQSPEGVIVAISYLPVAHK